MGSGRPCLKVDVGAGIIEHNESTTPGWVDGTPGSPSGFHSGASLKTQVRRTLSRPRSWADLSLL